MVFAVEIKTKHPEAAVCVTWLLALCLAVISTFALFRIKFCAVKLAAGSFIHFCSILEFIAHSTMMRLVKWWHSVVLSATILRKTSTNRNGSEALSKWPWCSTGTQTECVRFTKVAAAAANKQNFLGPSVPPHLKRISEVSIALCNCYCDACAQWASHPSMTVCWFTCCCHPLTLRMMSVKAQQPDTKVTSVK